MNRRRVAVACGVSAAMVVLMAWLLPREYLANDDIGFTEYLRQNTFIPWVSPILVRAFCFAYQAAPDVPWFGLYQYTLIFAVGAVVVHTCLELVDPRPGFGRVATLIGALVLIASHAILVVGITWTTVSISSMGTALAAFIAHVQISEARALPISRLRAIIYGLLFVAGYMLRLQGLGAVVAALAPLAAWAGIRCWRRGYLPKPTTVLLFVAPFAIVFAIQNHIPNARGDDWVEFKQWSDERGRIHGNAAYEGLDTRAPELVEKAGWSLEEYRDFSNWLIIDEGQYPIEKIDRLVDTGGVPEVVTWSRSVQQLRGIFEDSSASVTLFVAMVAAGVVLALRRAITRQAGLLYSLGYLLFLIGVPVWMSAHLRFPQRVSLSFYTVGALGVFVFIARAIADRPDDQPQPPTDRRTIAGAAVVAVLLLGWARFLYGWLDREIQPFRAERQTFEDRVATRGGFVFIYVQAGVVEFDPLRARPRDYDGLQGGWGTFSFSWYETLEHLGVHRGSEAFPAMVDNPNAYVLTQSPARDLLEDWIRRKVGNKSARLALVDAAAIAGGGRPELYRIVTTPMRHDSDEWHAMEHLDTELALLLPGPPDVSDLEFSRVSPTVAASQPRRSSATVELAPVDGGVRAMVTVGAPNAKASDDCAANPDDAERGDAAGIRVPVTGLAAARFEISLVDPQNIVSVNVYGETASSRSLRWRWFLSPTARQFDRPRTFTVVPGYGSHELGLTAQSADARDVRQLHVVVEVLPGTHAGFDLRKLEIAQP